MFLFIPFVNRHTNDVRFSKLLWHSGAVTGFTTYTAFVPDLGLGVFLGSNTDFVDEGLGLLFDYIHETVLGVSITPWLNQ